MKKPIVRQWSLLFSLLLLGAVGVSLALPGLVKGTGGGRDPIPGHLISSLKGDKPLHPTDAQQPLHLTISLQLADAAGLKALIAAQNDRNSPLYHHYITPQQFTARFAPAQSTIDRVVAFLKSQGVTVTSVAANHLGIDAEANVTTIERAFDTQIADFPFNGRTVYAPTAEPSVPSTLAGVILNIAGLDNISPPHRQSSAVRISNRTLKPGVAASGPGGGYTPGELRTAYDMNPLLSAADGTGQTIAIAEFDGYNAADINEYLSFYNLGSPTYSNVLVDGATNSPGAGAIEAELDMEVVSAIAPGATQKIYIAPNTAQGFIDLFNQMVVDNTAQVVSNSWGNCEANTGTALMQALDNVFSAGAAQGQAFFSASGDFGAYDCGTQALAVDYPASDPHVVGVGGTQLTTGPGGSYTSEATWQCPFCQNQQGFPPHGTGSGGGVSSFWPQPAYQTGFGVNNVFSNGNREVPDVSADADPNTGYSIYCTAGANCAPPFSGWSSVGGTSAAAPLWAGIAADLNQYLLGIGKPTLGNANPMLYSVFNNAQGIPPYHDITSSDNLYYQAGFGYDLATGMGTPDVWNIALNLRGNTPTITPTFIDVKARVGTNPLPQSFTIQNHASTVYNFSLGPLPGWAATTLTNGTLAPGGSITGTLTFNLQGSVPFNYLFTLTVHDNNQVYPDLSVPAIIAMGATSKVWYFAEGYTGGTFNEWLTIANPNQVAAHIKVQYFLGSGSPITKLYLAYPNSRFTLLVNNEVGNGKNVSMTILSDVSIIAERPMYFTYTGAGSYAFPGGTDVLGATQLSQNFDFGYLDTTANHDTWLTILNQNNAAMTVTIQYFASAGGAPITRIHTVAANSRGTVYVNGDGLAAGTYSALVALSLPGLVERPIYLKDSTTGFTGSGDVVGVATPQTDWYFAEGYTSPTFDERYILSNPSTTTAANATVTFLLSDGSIQNVPVQIPPGGQKFISANAVLTSNNVNNSAHVQADVPILAERFISFKYVGQVGIAQSASIPGASDVLGAAAPSELFYFAEGYTGGQFAEWLTIENPDPSQSANVQVTFLPANGGFPVEQTYTVGPHSRFTLLTNNVMVQQSFSMSVFSPIPIVAERPMYFLYNGIQSGGTDIIGYQA